MASKRGSDTFKHKWLLECGVEISARDIELSKPISAVCKFCKTFGKEQAEDNKSRKGKWPQNIQLFKKPWRADKMKEHNKRMHKAQWQEYQTLSDMEKKAYFVDNAPPPANSVLCTFYRQVEKRSVFFDKKIVEVLLDDVLFAAEEESEDVLVETDSLGHDGGGVVLENILSIFKLVEEDMECDCDDEISGRALYKAVIPNLYQYNHVIEMIACGLSFRQATNVIEKCKLLSNDTKFGSISRKKVSKYVRIHCAVALQIIKRGLNVVWSFSIALDGGNKAGTPYLDPRLQFVLGATLFNVHLLAIPMFESHTGLNMFNLLKKTMDA